MKGVLLLIGVCAGLRKELWDISVKAREQAKEVRKERDKLRKFNEDLWITARDDVFQKYADGEFYKALYKSASIGDTDHTLGVKDFLSAFYVLLPQTRPWSEKEDYDIWSAFITYCKSKTDITVDSWNWDYAKFMWNQ